MGPAAYLTPNFVISGAELEVLCPAVRGVVSQDL